MCMSKVILHIDLNAFFVRCEELKNPSLENKPVVIGHMGRGGIISTCSYEARKYGIHSGMPTYQAKELCSSALFLPGDYRFYEKKSHEFINLIKKYSKIIEQASIDECFVDMTDAIKKYKDPFQLFKTIQLDLFKTTGLKCSIGVAPTKFLAKMASDMKKPMGITIIRKKDVRTMLNPLPIEDFFGIGKKTAPRLREIGINTIGDLATLIDNNDESVKKELGKFYYAIKDWINGEGSDVVNVEPFDPKSIGHSTTFKSDTNDVEDISKYLKMLTKEVSTDAKKAGKIGSSVQIVLKDTEFKIINRSKKLSKATNNEEEIYKTACSLLKENFDGRLIRLVGVTLQNLQDPHEIIEQMSIFDNFNIRNI